MNRRKLLFSSVLFITVLICGCSGLRDARESREFADIFMQSVQEKSNETNMAMAKLNLGMTSEKVIQILGEPIKKEYKGKSGNYVETYFYLTDAKFLESIACWKMYTPLVFENGKLIGWGWDYFDNLIIKYELSVDKSFLCSQKN